MSAIFGLIQLNGQPVVPAALAAMDTALAMHGPDRSGQWHAGAIGLGQRLLCVTPEDAGEQQPVIGAAGQVALVANGCLHNRPELLAELGSDAAHESQPDSALLLAAYLRWGAACVEHLIGTFTFAVWDGRAQHLLAYRSPLNSPGLFFAATAQALAFATMPKGVFALPAFPRRMNEQYLADYLASAGTEPGETFYAGVTRLQPGEMLTVQASRGTATVKPCWSPDLSRTLRLGTDDDYVEAFMTVFQRAVSDAMRSQKPAGVMMSGGLDSTSVAAMAVQRCEDQGRTLATFTETPAPGFTGLLVGGRYADETPFVQAMARRHPALRLNFVHSGAQLFTDDLTRTFEAAEIPFHNASNRMWVEGILGEAQRQGMGVLMTGGNGNLTLSWRGDGLLAQCWRDGQWRKLWAELQAVAGRRGVSEAGRAFVTEALLPQLPDAIHARLKPRHSRQEASPILVAFAEAQQVHARSRRRGSHLRYRPSADTRSTRLRSLLSGIRRGDGLMSGYQALFGVTLADPTADVRLVEFCLSLPEDQYRRAGVSRWLVRRAMADHLPAEILNNTQRGLQAAGWFEALQRHQPQLREQLVFIAESELARRALDLPRLTQLVEHIDDAGDALQRLNDYRQTLDRGLMLGRFIRWVELGQ